MSNDKVSCHKCKVLILRRDFEAGKVAKLKSGGYLCQECTKNLTAARPKSESGGTPKTTRRTEPTPPPAPPASPAEAEAAPSKGLPKGVIIGGVAVILILGGAVRSRSREIRHVSSNVS